MNWQDTPVFINNFNNLDRGFRQLVDWLQLAGMKRIVVIDNHSTYQPLKDYYISHKLKGVYLSENMGHRAFWELKLHRREERFIVTDPDLVPAKECPKDLVRKLHEVMDKYDCKVGAGLRTDNLPDHFDRKAQAISDESGYWKVRRDTECFEAAVDTTFALYKPGMECFPEKQHLRLDFPYVMEHVVWYEDSSKPNAERDYYRATARQDITHWDKQ